MTESQRQVYCNGHHERMRGTQRNEAPQSDAVEWMQSIWLDGWDAADGVLYDRAIDSLRDAWQCDYCGAWSADMHREDCPAVFGQ